MALKQISVFVANQPGSLEKLVNVLAEAGVDMRAMSIADTQEFGIMRMIVKGNTKACDALREAGYYDWERTVNTQLVSGCIGSDDLKCALIFTALHHGHYAILYRRHLILEIQLSLSIAVIIISSLSLAFGNKANRFVAQEDAFIISLVPCDLASVFGKKAFIA